MNWVFGDGSVRSTTPGTDQHILMALATIANGEINPDF